MKFLIIMVNKFKALMEKVDNIPFGMQSVIKIKWCFYILAMNNWKLNLLKKTVPFTIAPKKKRKEGRQTDRQAGRQEVFLAELFHSKHPYVDALTPSSSECDCTWRKGLLKRLLS